MLEECGRVQPPGCWKQPGSASENPNIPGSQALPATQERKEQQRAAARKLFVAALAEWVNMHDLHRPFALGPPSKEQPCAAVDNEHSAKEKITCNKLYPRKAIEPGTEEIAEDPRRRDLYRLWLARNCNFLNNYVPIILLGMCSNMDFQATLTCDAVIEYMTKYMTKAGQGSLVRVMEHSFSLCIEKARENMQGSGSAVLRWFNLQSITEVKSQLEAMHLLFGTPRFVCSREFRHLYLNSEIRQMKSKKQIDEADSKTEGITTKSGAEVYVERDKWECPSETALRTKHALTRKPFWIIILEATESSPVADSERLEDNMDGVKVAWPDYVQLLSWWQLKRFFNRAGNSITCKPSPDVVVVHPQPRFTTAENQEQWEQACRWALLAYCNHGECCAEITFRDKSELDNFPSEKQHELMREFVFASPEERAKQRMTQCPPHIRKKYLRGLARLERMEMRKHTREKVTASMSKVRFVFTEEGGWSIKSYADMSSEEQQSAKTAWLEAEETEQDRDQAAASHDGQALPAPTDEVEIRKRMKEFMQKQLKWTHRELHDALLSAGLSAPVAQPSLVNYFNTLRLQFGDSKVGFLPQAAQSHTKARIQSVLRCLGRSGLKLGGKFTDPKPVLADRLAYWLGQVIEAGRGVSHEAEFGSDSELENEMRTKPPRLMKPFVTQPGDVPHDAVVTAEQAESALGHNQATELDNEIFEAVDQDQREEEEALHGHHVNPSGISHECFSPLPTNVQESIMSFLTSTYECLCWSPADTSSNSVSAAAVGWTQPPRHISKADLSCNKDQVVKALHAGIDHLYTGFQNELNAAGADEELANSVKTLDPTQHLFYTTASEWACERLRWRVNADSSQAMPAAPSLRVLLLGTAGTGKTHTAKVAITKVRRTLGSFKSVLTLAFSGVAAANLGGGARTVDSIFHTNSDNAGEDKMGEQLDDLVEMLRDVEMLVLDEVSTIGAASFEIISRRLEQVGKVLWRERYGTRAPEDLGGFGGIAVVLIGDFAQLPPVLSSSLLAGSTLMESKKSGLRTMALAGRQTFQQFTTVIRLRRIHRILGTDPFKESTMRLRDGAITLEDYELWKTHEVESLQPQATDPWPEASELLNEGLVLVTDNAQAGKINGHRLVRSVPSSMEPVPEPGSASSIVVRCEARHNDPRGERPKADEFRNVRKAMHIRVGAKVILITNTIWNVNTVPLGLMNGARGVIVAILYSAPNAERVDGMEMAGTGYPSSDRGVFPRGLHRCPLPEYVVVHFPDYKGPPLFRDLPSTWVPVPCVEVRGQTRKNLCRYGLPLRLAWALTIHKCQGITAHEGCIVSFQGSRMPRAVSKLGLAFVAWTRATQWSKVAFQSIPPLEEFVAVRLSREFQLREGFETKADELDDAFLESRCITQVMQLEAHLEHLEQHMQTKFKRHASEAERNDMRLMLGQRGVKPVSDSVKRWGEKQTTKKGGGGLWSIVSSFRADRRVKDAGDLAVAKKKKSENCNNADTAVGCTKALLQEHGYPDGDIEGALEKCGPHLTRCVEYCLRREGESRQIGEEEQSGPIDEEEGARNLIQSMGFDADATTLALEMSGFSFSRALLILLHGCDEDRTKLMGTSHFRRHTLRKTVSFNSIKAAGANVRAEYAQRATTQFHRPMQVLDFGMYAGDTTNACFWLCLSAGLSKSSWSPSAHALQGIDGLLELWPQVRACDLVAMDRSATIARSPLGLFAEKLRKYMCDGPNAVLVRRDILQKLYPAFAALDPGSARRGMQHYKEWVQRLADREFADELVILAVTLELNVRIVCIPYTRPGAARPWSISTYAAPTTPPGNEIVLGNNDVHFMWITTT